MKTLWVYMLSKTSAERRAQTLEPLINTLESTPLDLLVLIYQF